MCGRDTFFRTWEEVWRFSQPLDVLLPEVAPTPQYNRAPTQLGWIITPEELQPRVRAARWGLIPAWSREEKLPYATFNARSETVASKPVFRDAFRKTRCLVPSSGYYEWKQLDDGSKQPYFIAPEAPLMHFAGLFSVRQHEDGVPKFTYTILTQPAGHRLAPVHDRQPVVLASDEFEAWIGGNIAQAEAMLGKAREPEVVFHRVGKAVGSSRAQGPQLIEPLQEDDSAQPASGPRVQGLF